MSPVPAPSRLVATALGVCLSGGLVLGVGATPHARAETTPVPGVLSLTEQRSATLSVPVPTGVRPTAVSGQLAVTEPLDSEVTLTVGDRAAATVPATSGAVSVPVSAADVVDGALEVTATYGVRDDCAAGTAPAPVSLGDLTLVTSGTEPAPTSLTDFFPGSSSRIDVVVPGQADDALIETALNAVASLTRRYDGRTPVVLSSARARLPRVGLGQRLVRLIAAQGPAQARVTERFGLPELALTGSPDSMRDAVRALSVGDDLDAEVPAPQPLLEQSLAGLGVAQVALSGPGVSQQTFTVPQDVFGEQVDALRIQASGVHSPLPEDADVRLDTYVDDVLLDSQVLDPADSRFTVDVTTEDDLPSVSRVEMVLTTDTTDTRDTGSGAGAVCPSGPPLYVVLDTAASTITATPGSPSDTGFDVYPQVLRGELTVALRPKAGQRLDAASDAAYVLSSLQGAAASLIDVSVVPADDLVGGSASGLLVGADLDDAADLDAPLQYQESVAAGDPAEDLDLDVTRLFAALEAVPAADREVLVLGAFGPGSRSDQRDLTRSTAQRIADVGWSALEGDLYVATAETAAVSLDSGTTRPTVTPADDGGRGWWLAAAVAALLVLLGYQASRSVRADRVRTAATSGDSSTGTPSGTPSEAATGTDER